MQNEYQPQEERDETDDLIELPVTGHETYFAQFSFAFDNEVGPIKLDVVPAFFRYDVFAVRRAPPRAG